MNIANIILSRLINKPRITREEAIRIAKSASAEEAWSDIEPITIRERTLSYLIRARADRPYDVLIVTKVHAYTGSIIERSRWLKR